MLTVNPKPDPGPELQSNQLLELPDATLSMVCSHIETSELCMELEFGIGIFIYSFADGTLNLAI